MLEDNGSANAEVPVIITNDRGFNFPKTGNHGTWMYPVIGITIMTAAVGILVVISKKKERNQ